VSRDEVFGFAQSDGKQLWRHDLKEKGLTNVPSPIVMEDGYLISGQGSKGTSRIDVSLVDGSWKTTERWYARKVQFFYSNWARINNDLVLGVADGLLVAMKVSDGTIAGKWRGFVDGNLARVGKVVYLVDGRGRLNVLKTELDSDEPRFKVLQKFKLLKARCWTPPTVLPEGLLLRGGTKLTLVKFSSDGDLLENQLEEPKVLKLK